MRCRPRPVQISRLPERYQCFPSSAAAPVDLHRAEVYLSASPAGGVRERVAGGAVTDFTQHFMRCVAGVAERLDPALIDRMAEGIAAVRDAGGRLFILGVGGSAGNAGHAVNDFRKLCDVECYAPTDNVSELTARTNDEGWETVFAGWLVGSRISARDGVLVFSVGGGNAEANVSMNLVRAVDAAKAAGAKVFGIVGRDGGHTGREGDVVAIVPVPDVDLMTPLAEAYQAVIWHCLVSHPALKRNPTKW